MTIAQNKKTRHCRVFENNRYTREAISYHAVNRESLLTELPDY